MEPRPTRRPTPPLELLKTRIDFIVREQDEIKKQIRYLYERLDRMIEAYRDDFHARSSTSKGK